MGALLIENLVVSVDSMIGAAICEKLGAIGTTRRKPTLGRLPYDLKDGEFLPIASRTFFCSGINGFKACEADPEMARKVNVDGVANAAQMQAALGGVVVLLSSCAAETHPDTVYGRLKLETEQRFLKFGNRASIYRFGPVMRPDRETYPNHDYNPISLETLIGHVTGDFAPGLHRITNA